jgi:LexA DNA binding domain
LLNNAAICANCAVKSIMKLTVLDRTWEVEVWPASPDQAPNAVYLEVRHKPRREVVNPVPHGIRFGLTEAEVNRIAYALVEAATGNRATDILRAFGENAARALINSMAGPSGLAGTREPIAAPQPHFTKTQARYLAFIHRYVTKFGQAPAEADIQRHFLVSAPSVNAMMQTLTRKGLISRVPGVPRSIKLLVPAHLLPAE